MSGREPSAGEREFFSLLASEFHDLQDWYLTESGGLRWMLVSYDVVHGNGVEATWRLDYDGHEMAGGLSPACLSWDAEIRADAAGVDTTGAEGIRAITGSPSEAAALAAHWFRQRIA